MAPGCPKKRGVSETDRPFPGDRLGFDLREDQKKIKIREQTGQDRRNSRVMFGILNASVYADCSTVADANTSPKIFNLFLHFQTSISYGRFVFCFLVDIAPETRLRFAICPAY